MWKRLVAAILAIGSIATAVAAASFLSLFPRAPVVNTNASVWLEWVPGAYPTQLSNMTTKAVLNAGPYNNATMRGMAPGSTNVFVAFNEFGFSNLTTGVASVVTGPQLSISPVPISIISWTVNTTNWAGKTNVLMEQIDSFTGTFTPVFKIVPTNGQVVSVWRTNVGSSGYYRLLRQ